MYEITYLPVARQDVKDILLYISDQLKAPKVAMDLLDDLNRSISLLREFPYAYKTYRPVKPLEEEHRMLPVKNYAVFYIVREQEKIVEIQRVLYAKMDLIKIID
ncbi:MAG: type II toxin-antitoxin system RelE/ParE family toxin [Dehalobacterium sp.]